MLPEKLQDIINNHDPEDISISILKADFEQNEPSFKIQVSGIGYNDESNYTFEWIIKTINYRSSRLSSDLASTIEISDDNPLLWYYSDSQSEIYFNGVCNDADKLFIDLYHIHNFLFKGLFNFENTLNQASDFGNLLKSKTGLLANGPNSLMKEYANVLDRNGIGYSIIGNRTPTYWDGQNHIQEVGNAKVLLIGNSYIVADQFIFIES